MNYTRYKCHVCGEEMMRDFEVFLNHVDGHTEVAIWKTRSRLAVFRRDV